MRSREHRSRGDARRRPAGAPHGAAPGAALQPGRVGARGLDHRLDGGHGRRAGAARRRRPTLSSRFHAAGDHGRRRRAVVGAHHGRGPARRRTGADGADHGRWARTAPHRCLAIDAGDAVAGVLTGQWSSLMALVLLCRPSGFPPRAWRSRSAAPAPRSSASASPAAIVGGSVAAAIALATSCRSRGLVRPLLATLGILAVLTVGPFVVHGARHDPPDHRVDAALAVSPLVGIADAAAPHTTADLGGRDPLAQAPAADPPAVDGPAVRRRRATLGGDVGRRSGADRGRTRDRPAPHPAIDAPLSHDAGDRCRYRADVLEVPMVQLDPELPPPAYRARGRCRGRPVRSHRDDAAPRRRAGARAHRGRARDPVGLGRVRRSRAAGSRSVTASPASTRLA